MPDVPLRAQLACAQRELSRRASDYPRLVAAQVLEERDARHEFAAMSALCRTLTRLVTHEAEAAGGTREMRT